MIEDLKEIETGPQHLATERRKIAGRLGWMCALVVAAAHVVHMATSDSLASASFIAPFFVVGFVAVPFILRRGGSLLPATTLLLTLMLAAILGLALVTRGLDAPGLALLPVVPIAGAFLAGSRAAWPTTLAATLGLLVVAGLHAAGSLPAPASGWLGSLARMLLLVWVCSLVLALTWFHEQRLARLRKALRAAATRDALTGLANRDSVDDALALEHHRLARYPESALSIALLDIDLFEEYNETYGHQAADEVLKNVAEAARQRLRRAPDMLGRYGGDELLAILPGIGDSDAVVLAECIRRDVEALALPNTNSPHGVVTVSLGVTTETAAETRSIDTLLTEADRSLKRAKGSGRNCVVSSSQSADASR